MELSKLMGCVKRPFIPSELFRGGLIDGAWLDPSDLSTLYQDAAGTTPVTAVEQPVGLMLDKSRGLMLGPELVSNGTFDSSDGWTITFSDATHAATFSDGTLRYLSDTTTPQLLVRSNYTISAGKTYAVTVSVSNYVSGQLRVEVGGVAQSIPVGAGIKTFYVLSVTSNSVLTITRQTSGVDITLDNISVRELYGYHATQPITASRPTLSARYNLLTKTEDFADAAWIKNSVAVSSSQFLSPIGTLTANKVVPLSGASLTGNNGVGAFCSPIVTANGSSYVLSIFAKPAGSNYIRFRESVNTGQWVKVNLTDGTFVGGAGWVSSTFTISVTPAANGFFLIQISRVASTSFSFNIKAGDDIGDGVNGVYVWGIDLRLGTTTGPYQRVNTSTDYDTDERYFPKYLRFDGVDDYLNLPYMGLYAGGSASVVMGISRAKAGAVKYAIAEGNPAGGKNYIPFRLYDTGVSSRIVNDAGTLVVLTSDSAGSASSLPEILSFKDTGNTLTLHKNSSQTNLTNYTRAGSLTLNNLTVGAVVQASATENMLANLYGLIITKSALTDSQRIACERYLGRKSGVTL